MALNDTTLPTPGGRRRPLRRWEASAYLKNAHGLHVAPTTLAKYANKGGGPIYYSARSPGAKRGIPLYPTEELDAWALKRLGRLRSSTSDKDEEPSK